MKEKDLFADLRISREPTCMVCGCGCSFKEARCYAHVLDKGMHKKFKFTRENIATVCSPICHNSIDYLARGYARTIENMLNDGKTCKQIIHYLKMIKKR